MNPRVLLVGVASSNRDRWVKAELMDELAALTRTAGGAVVERLVQVRERPDPALLVGKGMAQELARLCNVHRIELLVFEGSLTPTQQRNLEAATGVRVIDRAAVILDIFAMRARTAEARVQVELAQLEYRRTHLPGKGIEMSRLGGGIGTRGPGETRLEVDRRRIDQRIATLRRELARIEGERRVQRRLRTEVFRATLVGYTNAGKSTLFNRLTHAGVAVSDRLFATLDASTRALQLDRYSRVLLTDTVGFIRNLPPQLIASFRSTLLEIRDADLVLHVVDASDDRMEQQVGVVVDTLREIGAADRPRLLVLNKVDRVFDDTALERLTRSCERSLPVSAHTGQGVTELRRAMLEVFASGQVRRILSIPAHRWDVDARIRTAVRVIGERERGGRRQLEVKARPAVLDALGKELARALSRPQRTS